MLGNPDINRSTFCFTGAFTANARTMIMQPRLDGSKLALSVQTASGGSATTVAIAGNPWTNNQFRGYIVKILTGVGAEVGNVRFIKSNTTNTLTIHAAADGAVDFLAAVGAGATFEIYTPSTTKAVITGGQVTAGGAAGFVTIISHGWQAGDTAVTTNTMWRGDVVGTPTLVLPMPIGGRIISVPSGQLMLSSSIASLTGGFAVTGYFLHNSEYGMVTS